MRYDICPLSDLPTDRGHEVVVDGRLIGLFRDATGSETDTAANSAAEGTGVVAIDGLCPHAGGPLATGYCRDGVVMCPWHGWSFRLDSGEHCSTPQIKVDTFPAGVEDGRVWIDLPDRSPD